MAAKKQKKDKYPDFFKSADRVMSKESIARANSKTQELLLNQSLAALREAMGITQSDVKGFSQPGVSKIETGGDMKISTVIEYLKGIGFGLEINAVPLESSNRKKKTLLKAG